MPQLDYGTFLPQIVWLFLTFIVLYLIMSRAILPKIADVLEQRQDRIASDLEEAEKLRNEAQIVLEEYEKEIENAHLSAQNIIEESKQKISNDTAMLNKDFELELSKLTENAEISINKIREQANSEIKVITTELAQKLTKSLINLDISTEKVKIKIEEQILNRQT